LSSELQAIQKEQKLLWNETATFAEKFNRQQDTIEKILRFLASVYINKDGQDKTLVPKKRRLLLEEAGGSGGDPSAMGMSNAAPNNYFMPQDFLGNNSAPQATEFSSELDPINSRISDASKLFMDINENIDSLSLNREALASVLGLDPNSSMENLDVSDLFQFSEEGQNSYNQTNPNFFLTQDAMGQCMPPMNQNSQAQPMPVITSPTTFSDGVSIDRSSRENSPNNGLKLNTTFVEDADDMAEFSNLESEYNDLIQSSP